MTYRNASRSSPRLAGSLPRASATQVSVLRNTAQVLTPSGLLLYCRNRSSGGLRRTEGRKTAAREKTGMTHVAPSGWSANRTEVGIQPVAPDHSPYGALSARGISIATAKTSVNAARHRRTHRQEPGHKGGVGGALKEARHRRREDAPGGRRTCVPAELPGVVLSAFEHRLDRTARTYLSFIGAPESDRLP
jgi:hypothetical protein